MGELFLSENFLFQLQRKSLWEMLSDSEKPDYYLVKSLAAIEDYEMVSTNENDATFILEKDQCWVLLDNESLKPKEARDSRLFGPVPMTDIVGRVVYALRSAVDHGPVQNSHMAMNRDSSVLAVELDVDEMEKGTKTKGHVVGST